MSFKGHLENILAGLLAFNIGLVGGIFIFTSVFNVSATAATEKAATLEERRDDTLTEADLAAPEAESVAEYIAPVEIATPVEAAVTPVVTPVAENTTPTVNLSAYALAIPAANIYAVSVSQAMANCNSAISVPNYGVSRDDRCFANPMYWGHSTNLFGGLYALKTGDQIYVYGKPYTVTEAQYYAHTGASNSPDQLKQNQIYFTPDGQDSIYLMTCAGSYVSALGTYNQRLIIKAVAF